MIQSLTFLSISLIVIFTILFPQVIFSADEKEYLPLETIYSQEMSQCTEGFWKSLPIIKPIIQLTASKYKNASKIISYVNAAKECREKPGQNHNPLLTGLLNKMNLNFIDKNIYYASSKMDLLCYVLATMKTKTTSSEEEFINQVTLLLEKYVHTLTNLNIGLNNISKLQKILLTHLEMHFPDAVASSDDKNLRKLTTKLQDWYRANNDDAPFIYEKGDENEDVDNDKTSFHTIILKGGKKHEVPGNYIESIMGEQKLNSSSSKAVQSGALMGCHLIIAVNKKNPSEQSMFHLNLWHDKYNELPAAFRSGNHYLYLITTDASLIENSKNDIQSLANLLKPVKANDEDHSLPFEQVVHVKRGAGERVYFSYDHTGKLSIRDSANGKETFTLNLKKK
ncbi:MAG: hypothetical protein HQK52_20910 [Oligoflexia bacterium]|nr:hypothetical protein [Oligoflexia bacterium]